MSKLGIGERGVDFDPEDGDVVRDGFDECAAAACRLHHEVRRREIGEEAIRGSYTVQTSKESEEPHDETDTAEAIAIAA